MHFLIARPSSIPPQPDQGQTSPARTASPHAPITGRWLISQKGPAIDRTLIGKPGYIAVGDPYRMRSANDAMRTHVKDGHLKAGHDVNFRPAK